MRLQSTLLLLFATQLSAQGARRTVDTRVLPEEGARPSDFVPHGWLLEREIQGNLTPDTLPERVLLLVEAPNDSLEERYRALIILSPAGRALRRVAVAPRLVADFNSGGMKSGTAGANIDISISSRRVLVVRQALGGANLLEFTHRFRFDPRSNRFALIGEDADNASAGQRTVTSTNYLSGVRVVTVYDDAHPTGRATRTRLPGAPAEFVEELDYEAFSERAERTPFRRRPFTFATSLGVASMKDGRWCAVLPDSTLADGGAIFLIWPDSKPAVAAPGALRRWNPGACHRLASDEPTGGYPIEFSARGRELSAQQMGIALAVASPTEWRVGADGVARADLDADGVLESATLCASTEGVHLNVWSGAPLKGRRRWHRYVYLGQDLEPSCSDAETASAP